MRPINNKCTLLSQISGLAYFILLPPASAELITIGKGSGIIWEGMPFSVTLTGSLNSSELRPFYGIAAVSSKSKSCQVDYELRTIGGYLALPLDPGLNVGLVPRAQANAQYTLNDGSTESLNGTIGLPETRGITSSGFEVLDPANRPWCLPPRMEDIGSFYSRTAPRTVNITGNWVMVADGNQTEQQITIMPMYAGSYAAIASGDRSQNILPSNITLRISTLECTVNTPTVINFGMVTRNTVVNSELADKTVPLLVSCGQPSNRINANINVQFRAISGLDNGMPSRLALNQGGGFITGEIDGGITGSGLCSSSSGLSFDGQPIKLGTITSQESQKVYNNQLTWRLCSGGASLPTGKVSAATEMLVTFN